MKGFIEFIRKQGVVGLAVGFILGGAISKLVSSFSADILNPVLSLMFGRTENLREAVWVVKDVEIRWGSFVTFAVDFLLLAFIVYLGVKILRLNKLDLKKDQ